MNPTFDPTEIDRLVDGELDPAARRDLLNRLDSSPDGWRCCALAFLEGQEFRALGKRCQEPILGQSAPGTFSTPTRTANPRRLAIAASLVALAFLAGFAARGRTAGRADEPRRLIAESAPREVPNPAEVAPAALAIPAVDAAPPAMPEYVQAQWARAGYDVKPSRRVISVEEGGRKATFPVDSYRFEFVGRPTY
ncbi:MAG TPA: hypothetical protein VGH33_24270 [Isosphaeraceae bacterium]|jgi:hypothetical protein